MAHKRLLTILAGLCWLGGTGWAAGRPNVTVSFVISEPRYTDALGSFRGALEAKIIDHLIGNLNKRVRFLAFTKDPADYRLAISLDRKVLGEPPPQGPTWEVGFVARLEGGQLQPATIYWQRFRPEVRYLERVGTPEELEPEIEGVADEADYSTLVRGLFKEIVIANSGHFKADPQSRLAGWILPYKHTEICADSGSVIEVTADIPSAFGSVSEEYETDRFLPYQPPPTDPLADLSNHLVCLTSEGNAAAIDRLIQLNPSQVKVTEVKVADYKQDDQACNPEIPPEEIAADFLEPNEEGQP